MITEKREIYSAKAYEFEICNTHRIPTRGGIELGATVTRPTASGNPVLLSYDPYRRGADGTASPNEVRGLMARYFARRGVCLRQPQCARHRKFAGRKL